MESLHPYIAIAITLLGTLVGIVWKFASLATEVKLKLESVNSKMNQLEKGLEALMIIPTHARRLDQVEELLTQFPSVLARLAVLEQVNRVRPAMDSRSKLEDA